MSTHNLPNFQKQVTLLSTIKVGTEILARPEHEAEVHGTITEILPDNKFMVAPTGGFASEEVLVNGHAIVIIDGKFVYTSMLGYRGRHPELPFAVNFATEQQIKGELSEVEILRQTFPHFASDAHSTYRQLIEAHTSAIWNASRELKRLGEYHCVANAGKLLIGAACEALEVLPNKCVPTATDEFEYKMALHSKMQSKFLGLGRSEIFEILNEKGIALLMGDFMDEPAKYAEQDARRAKAKAELTQTQTGE